MIPFQVDPSWYEKYWLREPVPRRLSAFALFRRGLQRFRKIQGRNVMTHAIRFHKVGEAREISDGIDRGDAAGGRGIGQEVGWQRPEDR